MDDPAFRDRIINDVLKLYQGAVKHGRKVCIIAENDAEILSFISYISHKYEQTLKEKIERDKFRAVKLLIYDPAIVDTSAFKQKLSSIEPEIIVVVGDLLEIIVNVVADYEIERDFPEVEWGKDD